MRLLLLLLPLFGCGTPIQPWEGDDDSLGDDDEISDDDTSPSGTDTITPVLEALLDPLSDGAALADLLAAVSRGGGWPLRGDGRWLFATQWPGAPEGVALVSDVTGWGEPGRAASLAPGSDGAIWYTTVGDDELLGEPAGAKYKWFAPADTWRAPPEALAYGYDTNGEFGWVSPPESGSHLERFVDLDLGQAPPTRTTRVYVPDGFAGLDPETVPVVIMQDGQNLFDPEAPWGGWGVDSTLDAGLWGPVVVVAVDSGNDRFDSYGPVPDLHPSLGEVHGGGADAYLTQVRDGVLPFVRDRYGLSADRARWSVAGSSMGGLVSLHFSLAAPETFACAIAMSPTLGWGAFDPEADGQGAMVHRFAALGHGEVAIWLDSGGGPGAGCVYLDVYGVMEDSEDLDNYCVTTQLRDLLEVQGYTFGTDLGHWWEPDAPHNEAAWRDRLGLGFDLCLQDAR